VANGTYETTKAAKLAAGTWKPAVGDDGMQNVDVLVKKTDNLLLPGQTITGVSGETVNVEPVTPPTGDQAASTGETQGEEAKTEGENDENNTENQQEGESGAVSDNTA